MREGVTEDRVRPYAEEIPARRAWGIASLACGLLALAGDGLVVLFGMWACLVAVLFGCSALYAARLQQRRYYSGIALLGRVTGLLALGIALTVTVIYALFAYVIIPFVF